MKQRTWQRSVIGIESSSFKKDTVKNHWSKMAKVVSVERKRSEAYKDKKRYKREIKIRI